MKKVLIIGVSGQDGSYLAQHLLSQKKYIVYGIVRKKNNKNLNKLKITNKIKLIHIKKINETNLKKIFIIFFDIIYFCGGQSNVYDSFNKEAETYDSQINPLVIILEHIRLNTGLPIFVDWKTVPYKNDALIKWYERINLTNAFYDSDEVENKKRLFIKINNKEHISHILVKDNDKNKIFNGCEYLFRDHGYLFYDLSECSNFKDLISVR